MFFQVKWVSRNFSRETIGEWWSGKFFLQTHPPRSGSGGHGARQQDHPDPRRGFFHGKRRRVTSPDLFWETAMSNMRTLACGNMWKHVENRWVPSILIYSLTFVLQLFRTKCQSSWNVFTPNMFELMIEDTVYTFYHIPLDTDSAQSNHSRIPRRSHQVPHNKFSMIFGHRSLADRSIRKCWGGFPAKSCLKVIWS